MDIARRDFEVPRGEDVLGIFGLEPLDRLLDGGVVDAVNRSFSFSYSLRNASSRRSFLGIVGRAASEYGREEVGADRQEGVGLAVGTHDIVPGIRERGHERGGLGCLADTAQVPDVPQAYQYHATITHTGRSTTNTSHRTRALLSAIFRKNFFIGCFARLVS